MGLLASGLSIIDGIIDLLDGRIQGGDADFLGVIDSVQGLASQLSDFQGRDFGRKVHRLPGRLHHGRNGRETCLP